MPEPSDHFVNFLCRLEETIESLSPAEASRRDKFESLALLQVLEPHMSEQMKEILDAGRRHWNGEPQQELLDKYQRDIITPLWRRGYSSVPQWQYTMEGHIVGLLNSIAVGPQRVDSISVGELAVDLVRLGISEDDLITAFETIYPELKQR